jgi:hypothetical protein
MKTDTTRDDAHNQASTQLACILEYVAALECDYGRLQELRDDRAGFVHSIDGPPELDTPEQWAIDNPEDAAELAELENVAGQCEDEDAAREQIEQDPLSVQVREDWHDVGESVTPSAFSILLCTGGPAVRIVGELDDNLQPSRAWLEYQDWGTPWTEYVATRETDGEEWRAALLTYCSVFYFGES